MLIQMNRIENWRSKNSESMLEVEKLESYYLVISQERHETCFDTVRHYNNTKK